MADRAWPSSGGRWHWHCDCGAHGDGSGPQSRNAVRHMAQLHTDRNHRVEVWQRGHRDQAEVLVAALGDRSDG